MRIVSTIALCVLALSGLAFAEVTIGAKAAADINAKVYMGMMPVDEEGIPNADGTLIAPVYAAFTQIEDRFCCALVTIAADDDRPGLPEVLLAPFSGSDGTISKNNIECTIALEIGGITFSAQLKGTVQPNGNLATQLVHSFGDPVPITFVPVNTDAKKYSGIYIGKVWIKGEAQPNVNNMGVAFTANGNKITGTTLFYLSDEPDGVLLDNVTGNLNTTTGAFSYVGEPPLNVEATGMIKNGVFDIEATAGNEDYVAKAYLMADSKWTNPNIGKKPKPKKLPSGKTTTVTIAQINCAQGGSPHITGLKLKSSSAPAAKGPAIYIKEYTIGAKALEVVFTAADGARGTFKLEFVNPSGKTGVSKKFKIK